MGFTSVLGNALESDIELVSIGAVVPSRNGVKWALASGIELCLTLLCNQICHFSLVIDPM